jgi:hypothetical protein
VFVVLVVTCTAIISYVGKGPAGPRLVSTAYQVLSTTVVLIVLLRLGIFASAIMFFVNFLLLRMPLTLDGNALYASGAWIAAAVIMIVAAAGFRLATTPGAGLIGNSRLRSG